MLKIAELVRRGEKSPARAHWCRGFPIPKPGEGKGVKATRLVHCGCPWWKAYYKQMIEKGPKQDWPPYSHGFLTGRRREDAMGSQRQMQFRLDKAKLPHITMFHDMSNAFGSTKREDMLEATAKMVRPQDRVLMEKRMEEARCALDTPEGDIFFEPRSGGSWGPRRHRRSS